MSFLRSVARFFADAARSAPEAPAIERVALEPGTGDRAVIVEALNAYRRSLPEDVRNAPIRPVSSATYDAERLHRVTIETCIHSDNPWSPTTRKGVGCDVETYWPGGIGISSDLRIRKDGVTVCEITFERPYGGVHMVCDVHPEAHDLRDEIVEMAVAGLMEVREALAERNAVQEGRRAATVDDPSPEDQQRASP